MLSFMDLLISFQSSQEQLDMEYLYGVVISLAIRERAKRQFGYFIRCKDKTFFLIFPIFPHLFSKKTAATATTAVAGVPA